MNIKVIPFVFVCHKYTQNVNKRYAIISTKCKLDHAATFLAFEKSTTSGTTLVHCINYLNPSH